MSKRITGKIAYGAVVAVIAGLAFTNAAASGGESSARSKLVLMAPAAPGGGWDGFSREAQQAIKSIGGVNNVQVTNVPGAGGTIGLSQFAQMTGRHDMLMTTGGVMIGATELAKSETSLKDVVPIARLADDYAVLVVPSKSDIKTLDDFVELWKKDPGGTSISGGSLGSIDHLLTGLVAQKVGIDPAETNYIAYSGGGEALTSMLAGTTVGGMSGYNEVADQIEVGTLRALAISSPERLEGVDVPTFKEQGVDAEMANWRGFAGAPGITEEQEQEFVEIITEFRESEHWQSALERNSWTDNFMIGDEFDKFIDNETAVTAEIVKGLGL
ncbi:Bug family tripartite tricarboxylate transporter substrate binding protein [Glutamicibacter sp.]|uniref:Bug family tripartite tricarboxylate transporter substrate binding protein n=1 Tax=Glutamicibacter sp. TaxID=1931995 RepID=UPI002B45FD26|nr:tripartite tricarboxylate transporter substrate-binding protein [Glutamicibacter sp.]HJX78913.1 tripartite tricarboxylate transporter substrate-binding protein [Glutamicibacter sp.]